jgi:hypothetical protein
MGGDAIDQVVVCSGHREIRDGYHSGRLCGIPGSNTEVAACNRIDG